MTVRRIATIDEYRQCQDLQRRIWGITEDGYVVPVATMIGAQAHGGLVLGAFLASGKLIGFSVAFLGRRRGRLCLYSQLTGVDRDIRSRGVGRQLKLAQRDYARRESIELITWAFDPLQAGNARFNLTVLGAAATEYVENMYGPRTDVLNSGMPTDRLIAEWETDPERQRQPAADAGLPVIAVEHRPDGLLGALGVDTALDAASLLLEIPADISQLKARGPDLAHEWQQAVRAAFKAYLGRGYQATGFVCRDEAGQRRWSYLLTRGGRA